MNTIKVSREWYNTAIQTMRAVESASAELPEAKSTLFEVPITIQSVIGNNYWIGYNAYRSLCIPIVAKLKQRIKELENEN